MPDNYINISYLKQSQTYSKYFYQRWSFFAPPPKFNDRLYYIFHSKRDSSMLIYEVLEITNLKKQANAPFNWNEDLLDYVLANSVNGISDEIVDMNSYFTNETNEGKNIKDSVKSDLIAKQIQQSYGFNTIKNYAKFVAKKNNIDINDYNLQLRITRKYIPKFSERNNPTDSTKEEMFFQSNIIK